MNRRTFLTAAGGVSIGLSGCLGSLLGYNVHRITMEPVEDDEMLAEMVNHWVYEDDDVREAFDHAICHRWNTLDVHRSELESIDAYERDGRLYGWETFFHGRPEDPETYDLPAIDCSEIGEQSIDDTTDSRGYGEFEVLASDVSEYEAVLRDEFTVVASDDSWYGQMIRSEYRVELLDLTEDEQHLVHEAIDDTVEFDSTEDDAPDGFWSLRNTIRDGTPLPNDKTHQQYLVLYDGTEYITELFNESGG